MLFFFLYIEEELALQLAVCGEDGLCLSESGVVTENQNPSWAESSARLLTSVYVVLGQHDTVGSPLATHRKGSPGSVRISSPLVSWFHYMFM